MKRLSLSLEDQQVHLSISTKLTRLSTLIIFNPRPTITRVQIQYKDNRK